MSSQSKNNLNAFAEKNKFANNLNDDMDSFFKEHDFDAKRESKL